MEELRELCQSGKDLKLSEVAIEDPCLRQILKEHSYVPDPSDPLLFVPSSAPSCADAASDPPALPELIPNIVYLESSALPPGDKLRNQPADLGSWHPCTSIGVDGRTEGFGNLSIPVPDEIQHTTPGQRILMHFIIEPRNYITKANVDVSFKFNEFSVSAMLPIKSKTALGFYPVRVKLWIEPKLDTDAVVRPIYGRADGAAGSTMTKKTAGKKVAAQVGYGPLAITGESSWSVEYEESMQREIVTTGENDYSKTGNTAVLEWKLLRWSHNLASYNKDKPHSGLSPWSTKSLKGPFPGGRLDTKVDFPDVMWHLPPSMRSKFPLTFKLRLEVEMHIFWFSGKNPLVRVAGWKSQTFHVTEKELLITDGINSPVPDHPLIRDVV